MASGHGVVKADQASHPNRQVGRERFVPEQPVNSDPHQAVMTGALPAEVAAPADTEGYEPVGFLHAILGDYRPRS
jgi:hypothetical protein